MLIFVFPGFNADLLRWRGLLPSSFRFTGRCTIRAQSLCLNSELSARSDLCLEKIGHILGSQVSLLSFMAVPICCRSAATCSVPAPRPHSFCQSPSCLVGGTLVPRNGQQWQLTYATYSRKGYSYYPNSGGNR